MMGSAGVLFRVLVTDNIWYYPVYSRLIRWYTYIRSYWFRMEGLIYTGACIITNGSFEVHVRHPTP